MAEPERNGGRMKLLDYQRLALRTEAPMPTALARLNHALLGFITENGEFTTEVKRVEIYKKPLDEPRRKHMGEEIGDAMWYLAIAADAIGVQLADLRPTGYVMHDLPSLCSALAIRTGAFAMLVEAGGGAASDVQGVITDLLQLYAEAGERIGIRLEEICQNNIDKLIERFPTSFSAEEAEARADKGGLDARNS